MKKLISLLFVSAILLTSCSNGDTGPQGPPGPQGPAGEDGLDGLGYTYENTVNFDYYSDTNTYSVLVDIPDEVATINPDADAVLVYRLEVVQANDGSDLDTWSLIPQNFFINQGTIQYVYNHTVNDVELIIDGNFDLSNLDASFTQNQTFRFVVVPSDFLATTGVDASNMQAVLNALNMDQNDVIQINTLQN